jgi:hypothetical protein
MQLGKYGLKVLFPWVFGVVVGDGFEPSKA